MVVLFVDGEPLAEWTDDEAKLLEGFQNGKVEFRNSAGDVVARTVAAPEPLCPWEPGLTREQIEREIAEGGEKTLTEIWKELGVK